MEGRTWPLGLHLEADLSQGSLLGKLLGASALRAHLGPFNRMMNLEQVYGTSDVPADRWRFQGWPRRNGKAHWQEGLEVVLEKDGVGLQSTRVSFPPAGPL